MDLQALRVARQRAERMQGLDVVEALPNLLARGMATTSGEAADFLGALAYALDDQPTLSIEPGFLLSFSAPEALRRLRQVRRLRLPGRLSPRRVWSPRPWRPPSRPGRLRRSLRAGRSARPRQTGTRHAAAPVAPRHGDQPWTAPPQQPPARKARAPQTRCHRPCAGAPPSVPEGPRGVRGLACCIRPVKLRRPAGAPGPGSRARPSGRPAERPLRAVLRW